MKRTFKKACSAPLPVCLSISISLQGDTFDFATISDPQANIMASSNRDEELRVKRRILRIYRNENLKGVVKSEKSLIDLTAVDA